MLNLFIEYGNHVVAASFTVTLFASMLLQALLKLTIALEHRLAAYFNAKQGGLAKFMRYFTAWLGLFVSKFVILVALVFAFGERFRFGGPFHGFVLLFSVVVFFMPARNGARCWIPLGFFDMQPSELAKLTFILGLSFYLMHRDNYRRLTGLIAPFLIALVPMGLILREPDLGSAMVFPPVLFAMLFAAGAQRKHLLLVLLLGAALTPVFWKAMNAEQRQMFGEVLAAL